MKNAPPGHLSYWSIPMVSEKEFGQIRSFQSRSRSRLSINTDSFLESIEGYQSSQLCLAGIFCVNLLLSISQHLSGPSRLSSEAPARIFAFPQFPRQFCRRSGMPSWIPEQKIVKVWVLKQPRQPQ